MNVENATFTFLVSWILWLVGLSVLAKTRVGYVLLYYSLLLMILFILVTEYQTLNPYITGILSIRDLNASTSSTSTPVTVTGTPIVKDPDGDGSTSDPLYRQGNT